MRQKKKQIKKSIKSKLKASEEKFKALYNHILDAAFVNKLTPDGNAGHFIDMNKTAYKMYKFKRNSGKKIYPDDLLAERVYSKVTNPTMHKLLEKNFISFETIHKDTAGRQFQVEVKMRRFSMNGEKYLLSTVTDITDQKEMEAALENTGKYYRSLIDESNDIIAVINQDGTFRYISPSVEKITGYSPGELETKNALEFAQRIMTDNPDGWLVTNLKNPVSSGAQEIKLLHKNGSHVFLDVRWQNIALEKIFSGMIINARDITEKKDKEHQLKNIIWSLENSNTELEQFAHVSSHDLKEPLRMISCYIGLLEIELKDINNKEVMEYLSYIKNGSMRMYELIQGLLTYSRIGKKKDNIKEVALNTIVAQVISNHIVDAAPESFICDDLPVIPANPMEITQLFQNLIGNAVKFRQKERPLCVSVKYTPQMPFMKFSVCDNGIGIEDEYRDKIFELFERLHSDEDYPGTGIGLTICRKIIKSMGGEIWVESQPGKGTCVNFTIPNPDNSKW